MKCSCGKEMNETRVSAKKLYRCKCGEYTWREVPCQGSLMEVIGKIATSLFVLAFCLSPSWVYAIFMNIPNNPGYFSIFLGSQVALLWVWSGLLRMIWKK